jgi:hypothetical protein
MPYSSFSLSQVQRQFDLKVVKGVFLDDVPTLTPSAWLTDLLAKSAPFAAAQGSEKVRSELIVEAPAIILIEAKKGDLNLGWGQCAAEMVAADKFNQIAGKEVSTIYGSVTIGTQWQFLKLTNKILTIDVTEYSLNPIDLILGIFKWMVERE